jgi:hypothetical protein
LPERPTALRWTRLTKKFFATKTAPRIAHEHLPNPVEVPLANFPVGRISSHRKPLLNAELHSCDYQRRRGDENR